MPSYWKAIPFLTVSFAMTSSTTAATNTTTVGGNKNLRPLVRKIKNSKKQGLKNKEDTCTIEQFLGTSQYTNCKGTETKVEIVCDNTDNAAVLTKKSCSFSEQPVQYEDAAAAEAATAVECGVHGYFDPETHLTRDHVTGECRLKFVALTDSCDTAPASSGFGVMVEAPLSTDNNHKDNSGLLLRFSTDAGATYYNNQTPRKTTVLLDRSSPPRTLEKWGGERTCSPACPSETFGGDSHTVLAPFHFETCYQHGDEAKYCWSKSSQWSRLNRQCIPKGNWSAIKDNIPPSCGERCQDFCVSGNVLFHSEIKNCKLPYDGSLHIDDYWNISREVCRACGGVWPITQPANCQDKDGRDLTKCGPGSRKLGGNVGIPPSDNIVHES